MSALAVLTCRPNSHPFQERHIPVHEQVKIGRSVARARPAANNAIFDCKVLSRNHALMWYENGKFYLQDTKSSNGTFVNNDRLSKGSEESPPRDIYSGDVIQFGVDVMENSRRGEEIVTHSCIIASIQLFHPDGQDATNDHSSPFLGLGGSSAVQSQELYQLAQYLQDALHREQMLENKLATLQRLVQSTQDASDSGWQALIDEDRLLSRLEVLENQLQVYSGKQTEETLRQELTALQEDKYNYETTAKESLRKVLEEKLEAVRKLSDLERSLSNTEDECQHLRTMCETSQKELQELAEKHQQQLQDMLELNEKLKEEEKNHEEETEKLNKEREDLEMKLEDMVRQEESLQAKIEAIQADNDFTKEQLSNMRVKIDTIHDNTKDPDSIRIPDFVSQGVQVDMVNLMDLKLLHEHSGEGADSSGDESEKADNDVEMKDASAKEAADVLAELDLELDKEDDGMDDEDEDEDSEEKMSEDELKDEASEDEDSEEFHTSRDSANESTELPQFPLDDSKDTSLELNHSPEKLKATQASIQNYKKLLAESETRLKESRDKVKDLQNELSSAKSECVAHLARITSVEAQLGSSETHMNQMVENTLSDMKVQLEESKSQTQKSENLVASLKDQISGLELEVKEYKSCVTNKDNTADTQVTTSSIKMDEGQKLASKQISEEMETLREQLEEKELEAEQKLCDVTLLKELLKEARESVKNKKIEADQLKDELDDANLAIKKSTEESIRLRNEISQAQILVQEKASHVETLKEQLSKAECSTKEVKEQILALRDGLLEEQEQTRLKNEKASKLQKQLKESEVDALQARNEVRYLKEKCEELERKSMKIAAEQGPTTTLGLGMPPRTSTGRPTSPSLLASKRRFTSSSPPQSRSISDKIQQQPSSSLSLGSTKQEDFLVLKDECTQLRWRIQDIEKEMKIYRHENQELKTVNERLKYNYDEMVNAKSSLEERQSVSELNLTDAQKDADQTRDELIAANEHVASLKDQCSVYKEDLSRLRTDFTEMGEEYSMLSYRSKTVSVCSMVPLLMLLFAMLLAFYPTLSQITATRQPDSPL